MNFLAIFVLIFASTIYAASVKKRESVLEKYKKECENVDIGVILKNEKLVTMHVKCLAGTGRCNSDGELLKKAITEAIADDCARCSEKQKEIIREAINYMTANRPEDYEMIYQKYDPKNQFRTKLANFMDNKPLN